MSIAKTVLVCGATVILYDFFKNGNISEFLLREGLAKCVDWSMGVVTAGPEKYRASEKYELIKRIFS